jgi:hypothetical protein
MQYGHCVTCATATAINCFVSAGIAPSANTLLLNARKVSGGPAAAVSLLDQLANGLRIDLFVF